MRVMWLVLLIYHLLLKVCDMLCCSTLTCTWNVELCEQTRETFSMFKGTTTLVNRWIEFCGLPRWLPLCHWLYNFKIKVTTRTCRDSFAIIILWIWKMKILISVAYNFETHYWNTLKIGVMMDTGLLWLAANFHWNR